jgi:predicted glutamine amidotransferase
MCELLGMECNVPTDIVFSFTGLALRGGLKGPHADGWGLALYEDRACRAFLEPAAAAQSHLATYLRSHPIKTLLAIAHVRKKTRGKVRLANTHPFVRELWGRHLAFAHNGTVRNVRRLPLGRFQPIGDTDSEYAFCALLHHLQKRFPEYPKERRALWEAVAEIGGKLGREGTFNFLLGDGTHLFARCATKLHYLVRKAPFKAATLADEDLTVDFGEVTTPRDRVAVVATMPLTRDEVWTQGTPNTLWVFDGGTLRGTFPSLTGGHGRLRSVDTGAEDTGPSESTTPRWAAASLSSENTPTSSASSRA